MGRNASGLARNAPPRGRDYSPFFSPSSPFDILGCGRPPRSFSRPRSPPSHPRPTRARAIDGTIALSRQRRDRCLLMRLRLSASMNHGWITMSGLNKYQNCATSHNNHNNEHLERDATRRVAISDFSLPLPRTVLESFRRDTSRRRRCLNNDADDDVNIGT